MRVRHCSIRWKLASRPSVLRLELEGLELDVSLPWRKKIKTTERETSGEI
jgi:hypothetical protein